MDREFGLKLKSIVDHGFSANLASQSSFSVSSQVELNFELQIHHDSESLEFIIHLRCYAAESELVHYTSKVSTEFQISDFSERYQKETAIMDIPDESGVVMLSVAISHARAITTKNLAGTVYFEQPFPLRQSKRYLA
ncbi:MAG: hypothetical protein HC842_02285 [Cytophagales bacterium]|nr:hypothetical protein [Cytophagales bacterium]